MNAALDRQQVQGLRSDRGAHDGLTGVGGLLEGDLRPAAPPLPDPAQWPDMDGSTFAAVDHISVLSAAGINSTYVQVSRTVPFKHREDWAGAVALVVSAALQAAPGSLAQVRGFKMVLMLPALLLRRGTRGGRRGVAEFAWRFRLWGQQRYGELVRSWERDCESQEPGQATLDGDSAALLRRVEELMARGKVSDAAQLMRSHGVASVHDPDVLDQMRAKHPRRRHDMEALPAGLQGEPRLCIEEGDVSRVFGGLPTYKGRGPSAWRYEFLRAVAHPQHFTGTQARGVLGSMAAFATTFVNGELPAWFYFVFSAVRCVPLRKSATGPGEVPQARPVGISCALRRALTKTAFQRSDVKAQLAAALAPEQLGVAVPAGGTKLVFAVREFLDASPQCCVIRLDIRNAFNEIRRSALLQHVARVQGMAWLARLLHATLSWEAPVVGGGGGGGLPKCWTSLVPLASSRGQWRALLLSLWACSPAWLGLRLRWARVVAW